MRPSGRGNQPGVFFLLWAVLGLAGCLGPGTEKKPAAVDTRPAPVAQPAPAQAMDPREERRLSKELLDAVRGYYRYLQEKNVEQAAAFAAPETRMTLQEDLWGYVARYVVESADVASYELVPQGEVIAAKVKVLLTLFEKNSVIPQKTQDWMNWEHRQNRWVLVPQRRR